MRSSSVTKRSPLVADREEARQHLRHLDAREAPLARLGVAQHHAEREREVRDVRERPSGADGERRQDGEDRAVEHGRELAALGWLRPRTRGSTATPASRSSASRPASSALWRSTSSRILVPTRSSTSRGQQVARRARPVGGVTHRLQQLGHAHHAELVEVGREDGGEAQALEQRDALVAASSTHPPASSSTRASTRATTARDRRGAILGALLAAADRHHATPCDQGQRARAQEPAQLAALAGDRLDRGRCRLGERDARAR